MISIHMIPIYSCRLTLVLGSSLNASLRRIREHTTRDTQANLRTDDAGMRGWAGTAAVVDQKAERDHEQTRSCDDEGFEATDFEDNTTQNKTRKDGREAVEGGDPGSALDRLVESHDKDCV